MAGITAATKVRRRNNIPWKNVEHETILLNLETGDYFGINDVGLFIWKKLDGMKNLEQVASSIASAYSISRSSAFSDLLRYIKKFLSLGLVTIQGPRKR